MSKPPTHALVWSPKSQLYLLHTSPHPPQEIMPGNEDIWLTCLTTHSSFSFQGQYGHLNVHKESRARGTDYWYAYHTNAGQTKKRYLGQSANLTLGRLEEAAQSFQETFASIVHQGSERSDPGNIIVTTRFSLPSLPSTLVIRERLLTALDTVLTRPLTLLSASAGWGKTTLLATWARRHPHAVVWFPLEEMDNDPQRFWILLIEALRRCCPGIGENALALLQAPAASHAPLIPSVTALLNELADQQSENSPIVLILDDYHVIQDAAIHASLTFWLEHLPPHVHLLLASRIDPELPLSRLRVRGHLGEIRDTDLRFTQAETGDFLTKGMGVALSEMDVELLHARTEGWIASLQLAALVLQKHADPSAYVQTLSGNQRFLLDYLREEVLGSLAEPLQIFLLQTSVLNRFNASLCDAVTEREGSQHLLEQVERANLFLQPLDEHQQWYRYHALWAQAMQHEAHLRLGAVAVHQLYSKASHWYEKQQMLPEAIEAALTSEDYTRSAKLIKRFVTPNSFHNEYRLVCSWLRRMPHEVLQAQPELSFLFALAVMITTDRRSSDSWANAEQYLQWAERSFESREQWELLGETLQLHTDLAFFQDDLTRLIVLTNRAGPLLTERSLMHSNYLIIRGFEFWLTGEMKVASQYLLQGYEQVKNLGDHAAVFGTMLMLGHVYLEKGEGRRALHSYEQALASVDLAQELGRQQLYVETGDAEPFFLSWAYHSLAQLAYERNELADAQRYLHQALTLRNKPEKEIHILTSGSLIQARLLFASGEVAQALDMLAMWERHARFPWAMRVIRICRARLQLINGDLATVEQWSQPTIPIPIQEQDQALLHQQEAALLVARLRIAQKQGKSALNTLAPWKEKAQAQGRGRSVLEIQILEALAHAVCQERHLAATSLIQALRLAHQENFQRVFLDEGAAMEALLKTVLSEIHEASLISFVRTLLHAFAKTASTRSAVEATPLQQAALLLEPLSEQEQRVLRLLAVGCSNQEIARQLVISVNTVKTHIKSLYNKLNIHNRVEASEMARRLSLL